MKAVVFGGSQGLGREVVRQSLEAGHEVTVFSRRPHRVGLTHPRLRLFAGDVLDGQKVAAALHGQDAAVCTLGLPTVRAIGFPPWKRRPVLSAGTAHIIAAMEKHGVSRFICETAIASGESRQHASLLLRLVMRVGLGYLFSEKDRQESAVRQSKLSWTIIRPTALTNGPRRGDVLVAERLRAGALTHVSRADAADVIVRELTERRWVKKAVTVSYRPRFGDTWRWIKHYR